MIKKNRTNTRSLSTLLFAMLIGTSFSCNDPLVRLGSDLLERTEQEEPASSDSDTGDAMNTDSEPFGTEPDSDSIDDFPYDTDMGWEWSEWSEQCRSCAVNYCNCIANKDVVFNDDTDSTIPFNDTSDENSLKACGTAYNDCASSNCIDAGPPNMEYPKLDHVNCNDEFFTMVNAEGAPGSSSVVTQRFGA